MGKLPSAKELRDLINATDRENPRQEDVAALRALLNERTELWCVAGDMARSAAMHLMDEGVKATPLVKESLKAAWATLLKDLGYQDAPLLEKLLVEQVVLCYLRLFLVEYNYTSATSAAGSYEKLDYWERRLSAAQRRFLRAASALAQIRKMQLPALQVNIGDKQVNLVGR